MQLRKAERKQAKIKLAIEAPSGAGKTYSALLIAKGLLNGDPNPKPQTPNPKPQTPNPKIFINLINYLYLYIY